MPLSWSGSNFKLPLSCRGLRFIQVLLQSLADGERDENNPNLIRVNVVKAYEQALKKYHGWVVQKIFSVRKNAAFAMAWRSWQAELEPSCALFLCLPLLTPCVSACCRRRCLLLRIDPTSSRPCLKERR